MPLLESPKSIIHAVIYWLTENATTCMVIFPIGIYGIIYSATVLSSSFISKCFGVFLRKVESFVDKCHPFNLRVRGGVLSITAFTGYLKMSLHVW